MVPPLPAVLAPAAPFPLVVGQSQTSEFVAPGVRRATYRLQTSDGPLVVNVVAIDPREPTVRFDTVLAADRLISGGETTSSMARRTHAVAGVNGDYFDIGNTNQPLGIVVRRGALVRTPSKRVALDVRTDRSVHFEPIAFSGSVAYGSATVPLTAVNEWPPEGGAAFLSADFGAPRPATGVVLAELVTADSAHDATAVAGTYRVAAVDDVAPATITGPMLAFGPAARAFAAPPAVGDTVVVSADTAPALAGIACAVGGGPLLLAAGRPAVDPNEPAPEEHDRRLPVSGAATTASGELLLASVDGRQTQLSIGVTRPQFAALFAALGANDAMAFDSGGSATLVARVLGDGAATVLGLPSDGEERRVADGFFVYSVAPQGPAAALVVRPSAILTLPHALVALRAALVDAAGHSLGAVHLAGGDAVRAGATSASVVVRAAKLRAAVALEVVPNLTRLDVGADVRAADPGTLVPLAARGFDARGREVELGDAVRWSADDGSFVSPGRYRAGAHDATVVANAGGARAEYLVRVGRHAEALRSFDVDHEALWSFAAIPADAGGSLAFGGAPRELRLGYDFSGNERAAAANATIVLPGEPLAFTVDVLGDGSGVGVRVAFLNRFGERRALTLARRVDWNGWQARTVALPGDLNPPVRLVALYAVDSLGGGFSHATGSIAFRNPAVVVAGTP
jgi:hypothetical protein